MIIDCYDISTEPVMSLRDFYGEPGHAVERCLVLFSLQLYEHLLATFPCEKIGEIRSCNGNRPIYKFTYKGVELGFYLTMIGSACASSNVEEVAWVTGATKFVMFGSCGSLDREQTAGRFILPTHSYRGEGCSYYYAPPADYIAIPNSDKMAELFTELQVPFVQGRVWTTDSMGRETRALVARRKAEGCIAVEMELAGVQATCDFNGFQLYNFLEAGDVLGENHYEIEGLHAANHDLGKLYIAMEIARRI